jgi:hypothetical protein
MSKPPCANRAEWQFELGKPAKKLSPHYQLNCDHGTAIMVCREQGGSEPVYLCEQHAEEQKQRSDWHTEARTIATVSPSDRESGSSSVSPVAEEPTAARPTKPAAKNRNEVSPAQNPPPPNSPSEPPVTQATVDEAAEAKPVRTNPSSEVPAGSPPVADLTPPKTPTAKQNRQPQTSKAPDAQPATLAAAEAVPSPAKAVRQTKEPTARMPARDLTFGNPSKAMVKEAIWNLPRGDRDAFQAALRHGKPLPAAAQAAGGQLAAIHRRIAEFSGKLDAILSASAKKISVKDAIDKPLEQATIELIENDSLNDHEKDAAIQLLGSLQEWAKYGLHAQFTPLEANRGLLAIGDRMNWGGATEISEQLKPAYRSLFASLRNAIHAAAPGAQEILERLIDLHAAKSDLLAAAAPAPAPELQPK